MAQAVNQTREGPWDKELDDLARAFSGAFIFGMPLLFTMEMWWIGMHSQAPRLLATLAIALVANCGLVYASGFRRRAPFWASVDQAGDDVAGGVGG